MRKTPIGYIGNFYRIPEYLYQNDGFDLQLIICEADRITKELFTFSLVRNVKLMKVSNNSEMIKIIEESNLNQWLMCSYGKRIPTEKINKKIEIYNIHYAMLPNYKGRHPTFWATMQNEKKIGISLHKVVEKLDEGGIISQYAIPYYIWMTEKELFDQLTLYVPMLVEDLRRYYDEELQIIKNNEGNYYPVVAEKDYTINLQSDSYAQMYNKVRCQVKYNGARLIYKGYIYMIKKMSFVEMRHEKEVPENIIPINDKVGMLLEEYTKSEEKKK